ncbi:MAG: LysR family transcriptional regulator [Clostridiales bacterium]|nr:LysR family transcriptional regulator [Clostridiales bacterium]MDY2834491.1 LysR family transcriptional regulator [Candidatus Aphodomonas sp.]
MELKEIDYMLAIADHGSILHAAEYLHITQSALSKYIKNMENKLGYPLFIRSKKNHLTLSPEGELYVHYAKRIDNERNGYLHDIKTLHQKENRIRVGIGLVLSNIHLTQIMEAFKETYPTYTVYICSQWMRQNIAAVLDGTLDFAFSYRPRAESSSLLNYYPVLDDDILVAIPKSHPLAKEIKINPNTGHPWIDIHLLENEPFILQDEHCYVRDPINQLFEDLNFIPMVRYSTNSTSTSVSMANRGLGIAICTQTLKGDHANVCFATVDDLSHSISNGFIIRKDKTISSYSRHFIDLFIEYNGDDKYKNSSVR